MISQLSRFRLLTILSEKWWQKIGLVDWLPRLLMFMGSNLRLKEILGIFVCKFLATFWRLFAFKISLGGFKYKMLYSDRWKNSCDKFRVVKILPQFIEFYLLRWSVRREFRSIKFKTIYILSKSFCEKRQKMKRIWE